MTKIFWISFASICCNAAAADTPLLGLPFAQPMDRVIKNCGNFSVEKTDYCTTGKPIQPKKAPESAALHIPTLQTKFTLPTWLAWDKPIELQFKNNNIVQIFSYTRGIDNYSDVVKAVTERFGKPSRTSSETVQNAFGAKWTLPTNYWQTSTHVIWAGCFNRDDCVLWFRTPEFDAETKAKQAAAEKRNKL